MFPVKNYTFMVGEYVKSYITFAIKYFMYFFYSGIVFSINNKVKELLTWLEGYLLNQNYNGKSKGHRLLLIPDSRQCACGGGVSASACVTGWGLGNEIWRSSLHDKDEHFKSFIRKLSSGKFSNYKKVESNLSHKVQQNSVIYTRGKIEDTFCSSEDDQ